ncbi:hypothetical protein HID58_008956 [Brassica napus]|uniref:Uncharacterized protein n=1 Tax=Brassica napus TaxID=3708 RepID=A0ABQ8DR57_BRANA|nr:hypothetical protein HID58_008956 [Brassica napus]
MTMVNVEDESVHGGAGDGDGTVNDDIAGSVAGEIGLSAKKLIHEASRSMELASSQPDASTILPTQLTVLFGRKVSVSDEIEQKRFEIIRIVTAAAKSIETKTSGPVASPALNRAPSFSSTSTTASPATQSISFFADLQLIYQLQGMFLETQI